MHETWPNARIVVVCMIFQWKLFMGCPIMEVSMYIAIDTRTYDIGLSMHISIVAFVACTCCKCVNSLNYTC